MEIAWSPIVNEAELFMYEGKAAWAAAQYCQKRSDEKCLAELQDWVKQYISLVAMPGTLHVGEVFCRVDTDGDGDFDKVESRVSLPMHWEAVLPSATAILAFGAVEQFCPQLEPQYAHTTSEDEKGANENLGCGCSF